MSFSIREVLGVKSPPADEPMPAPQGVPQQSAPVKNSIRDILGVAPSSQSTSDEPPLPPRPPPSSTAHAIGAGMVDAAAGTMNVLSDPFGNLIGKPLASAIQFGHDALAPVFGYERFPDNVREVLTGDVAPQPGTKVVNAIDNATGGTYQAIPPSLTRSAVAGAGMGAALSPTSVAPGVGAMIGAGGGAASEAFTPALPGWAQPLGSQAIGAAGGIGVGAGMSGMGGVWRNGVVAPMGRMGVAPGDLAPSWARPFANVLGLRARETIETPAAPGESGSVRATQTQLDAAANELRAAAAKSGPDGVAQFQQALENNPREIVPGSQPTTAQVAPMPGIAKMEDLARTTNGEPFIARDQAQNQARVAAIQRLMPEGWSPSAVGDKFRSIYNDLQQQVQDAIAPLAETKGPGTTGENVRSVIEASRTTERERLNRLYAAIDPDNSLSLPVMSGRQSAAQVMRDIPADLVQMMPARVRQMVDIVQNAPDVMPLNDVRKYMSQIGDLQREFGAAQGWESVPVRQLTMLKQGLADDIQQAATRIAETDAQAVASGQKAPQDTIIGRVNSLDASNAPVGTAPGGSDRVVAPAEAGGMPLGGVGQDRSQGQGGAGSRGAAGDSAVAAEATVGRQRKPETLVDFLIAKGGVRDQTGDLRAADLHTVHHQQGGRLLNPKGMPLDHAREIAVEAGFLRPNAEINDLLDALSGKSPVYRISEAADAWINDQTRRASQAESSARFDAGLSIDDAMRYENVRLNPREIQRAIDLHMRGASAPDAIRQAASETESIVFQQNAERNAFGSPGVPLAAQQANIPIGGATSSRLAPNFPPEKAAELRSVNDQYRRYKETFRQGPVGDILASGKNGQTFRMQDPQVAAAIVKPESLRAYLAASGGSPEAIQAATDAMILHMRNAKAITPDGVVDANKLRSWQDTMRHSLDQLPDLAAKVRSAEEAQNMVDRAGFDQSQRVTAAQTAKLSSLLNEDPSVAIPRLIRSQDRIKLMSELYARVKDDPEALASLRGHVAQFINDELTAAPKASMENAAKPSIEGAGMIQPERFKNWVADNKPWLIDVFKGGQGMQNLEMIAADIRRQQTSGVATRGSPTAERLMSKIGGHGITQTVMALLGEKLMEGLATSAGAHGVGAYAMEAAGLAAPILIHALRQRGITTMNALRAEAMLNPEFAKLLMQRPQGEKISPILQRRLAAALLQSTQDTGDRK